MFCYNDTSLNLIFSFPLISWLPVPWKIWKTWKKSGNLRMVRKRQGKCVLTCGQLPWVLFLTQNMQERSSLLGKVLHIEHSFIVLREYIIAVRNNMHLVLCFYVCMGRYCINTHLECLEKSGSLIMTGVWPPCDLVVLQQHARASTVRMQV